MIHQDELIAKIKAYDPQADAALISKAYQLSKHVHRAQVRESGDPYFSHPLQVASILTDMKLDTASIVTALLHDTVEDTGITLDDIEKQFGREVRLLVDGVTKLSQIELQSLHTRQAENFRKLLLAMSSDIRVLLVKLADRLHNMRTLSYIKSPDKRRRVARETMDIFAPLAGRIGTHRFKDELEDLAFEELYPDARHSIVARLNFLKADDEDKVQKIMHELEVLFKAHDLDAEISGRAKMPYSIWRKMRVKNVGFEQLADIMAFRILVDTIPECYQALGIIHSAYPMVPQRFKDFISTPKPNNYQSIHTTVFGPKQQRIEIQIRTHSMHEINEYGLAAHWKYKQGSKPSDGAEFRWLRELLEILDNAQDPEEFLEHTKLEMYQDQVFCFTPKGDLIELPKGSTPIDFAYAVHSEVGNTCVGAKINGRMVPLRTVLQNGDQVEITTSKAQKPSPAWEKFVVTGKARACIRRYIRTQKRTQFIELGRSIIHKAFKQEHLELSEKKIEEVLSSLKCASLDDVYALVGEGLKNSHEVIRLCYPEHEVTRKNPLAIPSTQVETKEFDTAVAIRGLIPGVAVHYAGCCHPLPGDKIVGIVITGKGVTIHTFDCDTLKRYEDEPDRWLEVTWSPLLQDKSGLAGRIKVVIYNKVGALANLTTLIGKNTGNILNLKIVSRHETFCDVIVDIEVRDTEHLNTIIAVMRASPFINSVERA